LKNNNFYGVRKNVLRELEDGFSCIRENFKYFSKLSKNGYKVLGACEWLLDNIYMIEKEYKGIKMEMPIDYFKGLPSISRDLESLIWGESPTQGTHASRVSLNKEDKELIPRIFLVAKNYINNEDEISCDKFIKYINEFQEHSIQNKTEWNYVDVHVDEEILETGTKNSNFQKHDSQEENLNTNSGNKEIVFTMGELWAFPLMLKIAIIINLSKYTQEIVNIQKGILNETNVENKWGINSDFNSSAIKGNLREEFLEKHIGEYINSIRKIEGISWRRFFENTSKVEKILKEDPENIYNYMDFESKDYYRHKLEKIAKVIEIDEISLANYVLDLAKSSKNNKEDSYKCHVGYYLIDDGISELKGYHHNIRGVISEETYLTINILGTLMVSMILLFISSLLGITYTKSQYIISLLIILIPINEIIIGLINWTVSKISEVRLIPKLNFSMGIPDENKTVIVIPAIVNSKEKVKELMDKLEVAYCGNKDKNLYFALLSDFCDSDHESEEKDAEIIKCGIECARSLNEKYCNNNGNSSNDDNSIDVRENKFFFLSRKRIYNKKQNIYMGKERKRGKLMEFMALIRNSNDHTYDVFSSEIHMLSNVKYLITLDEDTFMPRESAFKLVGAMSHVLNIPYVKENKVVRGYGVMQPKVSISLESKNQTYFSKVFGGEEGVDGYSVAYSDTYQDLFGEGSFTGKGIINIDEFYPLLHNLIKDDKILSHDLLEGGISRCALVSDVEFIDKYPAYYESSSRRLHRWVRGDWQLIGWLFSNKISFLYKWKIFDNLRRSLLSPNLLLTLVLSLTILNGRSQIAVLCFLGLIISLVFTVTDLVVTPKNKLMGTFKSFEQILLIISFIPYQSFLMIHAIIITLFRVCISKRNLLEWQSSEFVEKNYSNTFIGYLKRMWIAPIMGLLILYLSFYSSFVVITYNLVVGVLWIVSPYIAYSISLKLPDNNKNTLKNEEKNYLRKISRRIYAYYQDFVNEENNYLAPDNYQENPFKGVAHRTSPTNIGMGLTSNIVAYDLGYITMFELVDKVELILNSMKDLKKVNGHYLNWYNTKTKEPLWPRYVSTVDSGNLLGNLWVLKEVMEELKHNKVIRVKEVGALNDIYKIIEDEDSSIKLRFTSHVKIGEYFKVLNEILFKIEEFKDNEKISKLQQLDEVSDDNFNKEEKKINKGENNLNEEGNDLNEKENWNKSILKFHNEEANYWISKLTDEVKKKIKDYNCTLGGLEKLYSKEFFEGVPNIIELTRRCEDYKRKNGDNFDCTLGERITTLKKYVDKIDKIIEDINKMSEEMNFSFLYDRTRELFSIGYNVEENSLGNSYYDLLASESRTASFVAIAKNDVPSAHWFKLSRAMTNAFHTHSLVSWSGTMFEYFMPSLIMRNYPRTLLSQTYRSVIKAQINFAKQKKTPWGISESAFYKFDVAENYQYKAFGVPGLGLKRGLEDEIVISPYSTLMTLTFTKNAGIKNLKRFEKIGALGRYGFIEAIDYTKAREDKYIIAASKKETQNETLEKLAVDKYTVKKSDNGKNKDDILSIENNYPQNVDKNGDCVDNYDEIVDSYHKNVDNIWNENKDNYVDNVDNFQVNENIHENNAHEKNAEISNNPQKINKIMTYMVHHLGMSLMSLDNVLNDNILISRFHSLPEVKSTELLLKEKIPQNVTFERNEDFSIKNKYLEGETLIPRIFEKVNTDAPQLLLLCNGQYSSMITVSGSGYSKKNDIMLYRWKGDSTSDDSGMFFYIKNLNSNDYWSSTFEPCKNSGDKYVAEFNLDKAKFSRKDGNIETVTEIVVSPEENFEIRKLILNNLGDKARSIEITSYMEITLATFGADVVHPAFSNLFVQTEYDEKENILIGSRRGRVKDAKIPYIFHKVIAHGELEGSITYETSRINFIGRNRELKSPLAMDNDKSLNNTVGTVLDPIMSLRTRIRLQPHSQTEIFYITGICDSKEDVLELCRENSSDNKLNKIFKDYSIMIQLELRKFGIRSAEANVFQSIASQIFFLSNIRKNREEYIKNISKHQKDLWSYGISGDLPIIMVAIEKEGDINIVFTMIKFHYYLKLKGVKLDLVIYNDEEISYDEPLQKKIMEAIKFSDGGETLNKAGGIFIHNKATMDIGVKELLIGISRVYVDCKNNLNSYIDLEKNINSYTGVEKKLNSHMDLGRSLNSFGDLSKDLNSHMDLKNSLASDIILENNNEIPYEEYDHDMDVINGDDLLKGTEETQELQDQSNLNDIKENLKKEVNEENVEHSYNVEDSYESFNVEDLDFFNGYGGFSKEDNSYIIKLSNYKNTPAPWINVISNEDFGFHISEAGAGYTWCGNSRENKITPWSNDYIRDPLGEALYIKDNVSGNYFSISPKPVRDSGDYLIKHSFGYSEFNHTAYDLKGKLEVFAPKGERVKIQRVTLENLSDEDRDVSVFYYAKLVLGVYEYDSSRYISTYINGDLCDINGNISKNNDKHIYDKKENSGGKKLYANGFIGGSNPYSEYFGKLNAYLTILGGENLSFTGDNKEFIGIGGEISEPEGLNHNNLSNRFGGIYDPCLAAVTSIKLRKGEKKEVVILFGQEERENIEKVINKYKIYENVEAELDKVKQYWSHFLGNIQVKTPDKSLDYLLNGWLLYQTLSCRYLSRSAFYQSGGAYGFRDQLQDSMALGVADSKIPKAQILRSASRQYVEGDVQHWWHPVVNSGIRTRFSDDLLWLPYVTAEYINSTGDYEILNQTAPYLEDEPLREGEDERYTIVNQASKEGTIYEHCLKAIEKSLKFGVHNIPLMGSGDWNDGMSTVGNEGKGESVWLGWFLYSILGSFIEIAEMRNDKETKNYYEERKEFIRENLEKNAWDGGWYRRAYFDDGTPLGSRENPECQIDSLAQSWSIISGAFETNNKFETKVDVRAKTVDSRARAIEAMEAVDRNLVKKDKGMILLLTPPFSNSKLEPGYIKGYVPGVRENGGQYTHAAVWVILALTKLGLGDKATKYFNMINPINHTKTELECMMYKVEPYVMAADVYIKEPHAGRGGWSWYTGASGWMYRVGIEDILGLRKVQDKGYVVEPCVPKDWKEFEVKITNEKEDYCIKVFRLEKEDGNLNENQRRVIINGKVIEDNIIPRNAGKLQVEIYFE